MRRSVLAFLFSLLPVLSGCAPKPVTAPASSPVVPASLRAVSVSPAVLAVQSHPLYKQAETAAANKNTAHAVSLLRQLADTPSIEPEGKAFCLKQIKLLTLTPSPKSGRGEKMPHASGVPIVASADCGPRALSLALHSLGKEVPVSTLSQWAKTDAKGTSMKGLQEAAGRAGVTATGLQVSREGLEEITVPALAWKNGNHYVAVIETNGSGENWQAVIADPNEQNPRTMSREEFLQMCGGYVLTLRR